MITGQTMFGLRIEGPNESIRHGGMGPSSAMKSSWNNYLAVTDRRVVFVAPEHTGDKVYSIPFDKINGVDTVSGATDKVMVQTGNRTYNMEVSPRQPKETISRAIRERSRQTKGTSPEAEASAQSEQEPDPLDRIEQLDELRERGAISEEEFEEKKAELLDQV